MEELLKRIKENSVQIPDSSDESNIVRISTIGHGNSCFIHSLLQASSKDYKSMESREEKIKYAESIRAELLEKIQEPNELYPTLESVNELVIKYYGLNDNPLNIRNFLRIAYKFNTDFLEPPNELIEYKSKVYTKEDYISYLTKYREYLTHYKKYLQDMNHPKMVHVSPKITRNDSNEDLLEPEWLDFCEKIKEYHEYCSKINLEKIKQLKVYLEDLIGIKDLYNPQNFAPQVIESHIAKERMSENKDGIVQKIFIPDGKYKSLPFNAYYFTANNGANLDRFEEFEDMPPNNLERIKYVIQNGRFLSEQDVIPYVPEIMGVNIIIVDYKNQSFIHEYNYLQSGESDDKYYIVIDNFENIHFSTVGVKTKAADESTYVKTLFKSDHPFIQLLLNSKNGSTIDWEREY
jgi:hypothetical protein